VDLDGSGRIGVLGEPGLGPFARQHGAGAGVAERAIPRDAPQGRTGLVGLVDRRGGVEQPVEGGVEGRILIERGAVDRRHGGVLRARQRVVVDRRGRGQGGLDRGLGAGQVGQEQQEGLEVALLRIGAESQAALQEQRFRVWQACEGRRVDAADHAGVGCYVSGLGHAQHMDRASRPGNAGCWADGLPASGSAVSRHKLV